MERKYNIKIHFKTEPKLFEIKIKSKHNLEKILAYTKAKNLNLFNKNLVRVLDLFSDEIDYIETEKINLGFFEKLLNKIGL